MLEKLKQLLNVTSVGDNTADDTVAAVNNAGAISRENIIYGEDRINKQKLYETWACKDSWHLHDEGIPLLLGIDPGYTEEAEDSLKQQIEELWQHANDCVAKKMLVVTNNDAPDTEWRVAPTDLYCWATVGRITVPQELSALMEFVLQTVKSTPATSRQQSTEASANGNDALYQKHCEITLGAAVALMVNSPDVCQTSQGKFRAALIAAEILRNAEAWFGKEEPLLARSAMTDLLDNYIARARLPVDSSGD